MAKGGPEGEYYSEAMLPVESQTGARSTAEDFGSQVGERMQQLGESINKGSATIADIGEMHAHIAAQSYVSNAMTNHANMVDKFMADPKNYSDPNFSHNVQQLFTDNLPDLLKNAPNRLASNQLKLEYNDLQKTRLESAFKTQSDVMMQKGFNDFALAPNQMLDSYRTNLKSPNIDAGGELYKQTDMLFKKIDATYGTIAPQMARDLKEQVTSQAAYGVVNTDPDLAEKILNRGYIEGRTRHFLEDSIQTARQSQNIAAKQTAIDETTDLLKKADVFPDQVFKGFPAAYYEAHGYKPKEAQDLAMRVADKLAINSDAAKIKDNITGMNEQSLLKEQDSLYASLKSDPNNQHFDHDAEVFSRTQKFVQESIRQLHEDPIQYLSSNNKDIASATQNYRDDPSPDKFQNMVSLLKKYQGAAPSGEDDSKYLNLSMHEMHLLDKSQAQQIVGQIQGSGPRQAAKILHDTIQSYHPDDQAAVLNDLVNHGNLPGDMWSVESHYGAPFQDKLMGALMSAKDLEKTVGSQKGSTREDFDKIMQSNNDWMQWSKSTAADNFQRQSIVSDVKSAAITYAMGMVQDGKTPAAAMTTAIDDLILSGHTTANVNGRTLWVSKDVYKGTPAELSRSIQAAMVKLDPSRINLTDDNHRPLFPVLSLFGHEGTAQDALRDQIQRHVVPNMNPDGHSFSLYYEDSGNHFQLRGTDHKPIMMEFKDLPTVTDYPSSTSHGGYNPYGLGGMVGVPDAMTSTTNWPAATQQHQHGDFTGKEGTVL